MTSVEDCHVWRYIFCEAMDGLLRPQPDMDKIHFALCVMFRHFATEERIDYAQTLQVNIKGDATFFRVKKLILCYF